MVQQTEREQLNRLAVKTLDQVFITRAKEGLGCSLFEAQALTDLVKEVYWEGILRVVAFFLFAGFGFLGGLGVVLGILGIVDLLIGLVYLIGLPKTLKTTAANLLLDRVAWVTSSPV